MNKKQQLLFNMLVAVVFCTTTAFAQKQSKTYQETFNVSNDAVLEINTSHTDIEFETWDKNQVEIIATVVLEEASDEEAKEYFENEPFKIVGNSKAIAISTSRRNSWTYGVNSGDFGVESLVSDVEPLFLDIEIPELPEVGEFSEVGEFPEVLMSPPFPPMNFKEFDYDAYEKDGDKYLKEWTKEFRKNFNEDYKDQFKEWGEAYQKRAQERAERMEKRAKERAEAMEERAAEREELIQERMEAQEERRKEMQELREEIRKKERLFNNRHHSSIRFSNGDKSNIFYFSSDGEPKKYKVKKSIKIKLPKSTRIKMDVRHGEVKLAATTKNINASLRYASLLASTIDGNKTDINASYTPVVVQKWNFGRLKTNYAEHVSLKQVGDLKLSAVSSNVIIDRLNDRAVVNYDFGELVINSISDKFSDVDVSLVSGEFRCKLPETAVSFYLNGTKSKISYPSELVMDKNKSFETVIHKGHKINNTSGKMISVNSKYGEVVLEN